MLFLISVYPTFVLPTTAQRTTNGIIKQKESVTAVTLNGLKITIDKQTGSILEFDYPGPGKMLEAKTDKAGIIDLAYPIPEFEPLRLASRYSTGAQIIESDNSVIISWDNLGSSRGYFKPSGNVSAKVWITAMPDGRSVSFKCRIENESKRAIGQVLFPDLHGLLPFAGKEETYLRSAGFVRRPFLDIGTTLQPEFYAVERGDIKNTYTFTGGENLGDGNYMIGRWLDYGGLIGGISLFPRLWTGAPATKIRVYRLEKDPNLRLMDMHDTVIKPGTTWESPEYILTPHRFGWAKGIEPYREFVKDHIKRQYPLPENVRKGFGFRTVWMCKGYPADGDKDVAFKFTDLPKVAKEAKEHGLDELMIWFWNEPFQLPIAPPYSHLGTPDELSAAVKECNRMGVNLTLFISVFSLAEPTASRFGLKIGGLGWTYHTELIPNFNPKYAKGRGTVWSNTSDSIWRQEILDGVKNIYNRYTHSIGWDQANPGTEYVITKFLPQVKEVDPRATFSGEITGSAERCADFLDYTWNWESGSYYSNLQLPYRDIRGFISSFPSPRLNFNINRNTRQIKYAFMDNSYLNVMPTASDDANGTAWISDYPEVSRVLKQCAGVKSKFLNYFTDGTLIGECLLERPLTNAHVNAYVLPDRVLLIIMNTQDKVRTLDFKISLAPWIKSSGGDKFIVKSYDQYGKSLSSNTINSNRWASKKSTLGSYEIEIFEFIKR